jgi:sec-independent protein translocase protein TatA
MSGLFANFMITGWQVILLLVIGIVLFGRRLPELGKSLGKSIVEFKKGMAGLEDEINAGSSAPKADAAPTEAPRPPQRITTPTAPRFDNAAPHFEDTSTNVTPTPPKI